VRLVQGTQERASERTRVVLDTPFVRPYLEWHQRRHGQRPPVPVGRRRPQRVRPYLDTERTVRLPHLAAALEVEARLTDGADLARVVG